MPCTAMFACSSVSFAARPSRCALRTPGSMMRISLRPTAPHVKGMGRSGSPGVFAASSAVTEGTSPPRGAQPAPLKLETDSKGVQRLALQPEGWETWQWRGHNINWLAAGEQGPVVLLIHGFGASVYHWRYNVPELSKHCRVYALDCLGFGWSSKPLVDYASYTLWEEQIADFIREVVGGGEKVVLVGNSLGGYNSLATAAKYPDLVKGVVLLNAAGRFDTTPTTPVEGRSSNGSPQTPAAAAAQAQEVKGLWAALATQFTTTVKRGVVLASFVYTKNPLRIKQVLQQVYHCPDSIDEDLVRSIALPARDPQAAEVFYRIITGKGTPMNQLLDRMDGMPMLLLWGSRDPWCVPARATQIQQYYPTAERVDILSGHCPHDDTPDLVNGELLRWVRKVEGGGTTAAAAGAAQV